MPTDDRPQVDVLLGGLVFCDLVFAGVGLSAPAPGTEVYADSFTVTPGGTATRAVAVARLGLRTGLAAMAGTDMFGERLVADLAAEPGLDLRWLERGGGIHTPVTVATTDGVDRGFLTYEEPGTVVPPDLDPLPMATVCNISVGADVPAWVRTLRAEGTLVVGGLGFDPTQLWDEAALRRFAEVDVLCVSDVEAGGYARTADADEAAEKLSAYAPVTVVTCGAQGVVAHDARSGTHLRLPALRVDAVDPTGAGDNFVAGLMLGEVAGWDLTHAIRFGTLTAAISVQRLGGSASAPTAADVAAFLDEQRPVGDWSFARDWARTQPAA